MVNIRKQAVLLAGALMVLTIFTACSAEDSGKKTQASTSASTSTSLTVFSVSGITSSVPSLSEPSGSATTDINGNQHVGGKATTTTAQKAVLNTTKKTYSKKEQDALKKDLLDAIDDLMEGE